MLAERIHLFNENEKFESLITSFKLRNPKTVLLSKEPHKIELSSDKPIQSRPYNILYGIWNRLKLK